MSTTARRLSTAARRSRFLDTNVLLDLLSSDAVKADRAEASIQILSEFMAVARRQLSLAGSEIDEILSTVRQVCRVEAITIDTCVGARVFAKRHRLSWSDAMIAASAAQAECATLCPEDFQHGFRIDPRLKVVNPFARGPAGMTADPSDRSIRPPTHRHA